MRQSSNSGRRLRGRPNRNKPHGGTPNRNSTFESNGPEGKVRGNATQVFEKYLALAREAAAAGNRVGAEAFYQHAEHYFRFLDTAGIEPTNNAMEQRFRFVVIDRKITQGTRGETGRRWCQRNWTLLATCSQPRRSAFQLLYDSILANLNGQATPCLLPASP